MLGLSFAEQIHGGDCLYRYFTSREQSPVRICNYSRVVDNRWRLIPADKSKKFLDSQSSFDFSPAFSREPSWESLLPRCEALFCGSMIHGRQIIVLRPLHHVTSRSSRFSRWYHVFCVLARLRKIELRMIGKFLTFYCRYLYVHRLVHRVSFNWMVFIMGLWMGMSLHF